MHYIIGAVVGYLAGVATPGIIKKIRTKLFAETAKVEAGAKADAGKIEKKL